jgi:hypothetical protein
LTARNLGEAKMAGDWFQIDDDLPEKPETQMICDLAKCHADVTLGRLILFWRWVDRHATCEFIPGASVQTLCRVALGDEKFWESVAAAGWLTIEADGLRIPGWSKRFSASAKRRLQAAKRQRNKRAPKRKSVTLERDVSVTRALPKGKENESVISLLGKDLVFPSSLRNEEFEVAWQTWEKHRRETKHPLTPTQIKAQLKMLNGIGLDRALRMINHTVAMGWRGLREPEETARNGHAPPPMHRGIPLSAFPKDPNE